MKILYYYWNENSMEDCTDAMKRLGHCVCVWSMEIANHACDDKFSSELDKKLSEGFDCIFSFDYFPLLSEGAMRAQIPYISWVYDCPHYTLESVTLGNKCNRVFVFDYALSEIYRAQGFETVDYMPLPVNTARLSGLLGDSLNAPKYEHDVTFVGSLYNDEYNFYDKIGYLPEHLKGYLDAVIDAQELIYGMDLPSQMLTPELLKEISKYVNADLGNGFRSASAKIICDMLRKKVTVNERKHLLKMLGDSFPLDIYSGSKPPAEIRASYKGTCDYFTQMPKVFSTSRINLNISLRSILTGIPLRVVDILGAGGFCLTNYQAELEEYFQNGVNLVWFDSADDMLEKVSYYLENDEIRKEIARNGRKAAEEAFSYDVLLPKVLKV